MAFLFFFYKNNSWIYLISYWFGGLISKDSDIYLFLRSILSNACFVLYWHFYNYAVFNLLKLSFGTSYPFDNSAEFRETIVKYEFPLSLLFCFMFIYAYIDVLP